MTDYTPTTETVRTCASTISSVQAEEFDRWLAAHVAEVLRTAAAAMRSHKDPGHWNLRDEEYPADMAQSPDRWLERRADRLAAGPDHTDGS